MKIKKGVSWSKTEEGLMVIHPVNDQCLVLNPSGEIIWNVLLDCESYDQLVEKICNDYESNQHEIIKEDIKELLKLLKDNDYIEGELP